MGMSLTTPGVILTGNAALAQSLALYFRTPKGSICLHPERGFPIFDYVDRNYGDVLNLIREVRTGIALWDNRIIVIRARPLFETGKLTMFVTWQPVNDNSNTFTNPFILN